MLVCTAPGVLNIDIGLPLKFVRFYAPIPQAAVPPNPGDTAVGQVVEGDR
jgi:hypothetical protein